MGCGSYPSTDMQSVNQSENEIKRKDKLVFPPCKRTKKAVEYDDDGDANSSWSTWNDLQRLAKKTGIIGNQRKNRNRTDSSIVKIS